MQIPMVGARKIRQGVILIMQVVLMAVLRRNMVTELDHAVLEKFFSTF